MRTLLTVEQRDRLTAAYSEPHRKYHTLQHIAELFQLASAHGLRLSIPQQLAIWYHDYVYNPEQSQENEQRSAYLLRVEVASNCWLSNNIVDRASKIILATKRHLSDDNETQVVLDLDLAGLGFEYESYMAVGKKVREEYKHLSDEIWGANRKIFINNMLSREHIFYTSWARDFYEKSARRNLQRELESL